MAYWIWHSGLGAVERILAFIRNVSAIGRKSVAFGRGPVQSELTPTRLIVGLGNPGREYTRSRHNVGFVVVDALARKWQLQFTHRWSKAQVAVGVVAGVPVALAKPQTYMNASGESVKDLMRRFGLRPEQMIVVCDDLDRPPGKLRLRESGSAGGHRGVQSTIDRLGSDGFARMRIGIGRPRPEDAAEYVLAEFPTEDRPTMSEATERAVAALECYLTRGLADAMNEFNC